MKVAGYPALAVLLAVSVAGCGSTPVAPAPGSTSSDAVDEVVGIQELRREVAELRNTVEIQRNDLERLRERQRQLYDDLDYRLRQGEQGSGSVSGQGDRAAGQQQGYGQTQQDYGQTQSGTRQDEQSAYGQQPASPPEAGEQDVYGQQGIAQQGQSQVSGQTRQQSAAIQQAPGTTGQGSSQQSVASTEEQSAYDDAFELLKQSRYNDAIIEFRSLISQFPNGALVDDAQYWIGEAYYVTRDFNSSLEAFQTVVDQYPNSQRLPEALLKLGYVQAELGQTQQARQTLNQVISQYPGSRVAISAETRLSKIR